MVAPIFAQKNFHSARLNRGGRCFELHCRRAFLLLLCLFWFLCGFAKGLARSSTASAIYHTCVMSLVTCNWIRGEMCGALDAESSDRGANPREASLRRECAWDCGHANAADTGKHAQASKHKQHKRKNSQAQPSTSRQAQTVKCRQSVGRCFALACPVWRGALGMRVLLALGEVLVSARLPRQSGLSFEFCMPGGDASTVQWLRSWSSDFIESRWASWTPSR